MSSQAASHGHSAPAALSESLLRGPECRRGGLGSQRWGHPPHLVAHHRLRNPLQPGYQPRASHLTFELRYLPPRTDRRRTSCPASPSVREACSPPQSFDHRPTGEVAQSQSLPPVALGLGPHLELQSFSTSGGMVSALLERRKLTSRHQAPPNKSVEWTPTEARRSGILGGLNL